MTFLAIHIVITFGIGFFFGSIFGLGVYYLRRAPPNQQEETSPPAKKLPILVQEKPAVQTLDIPSIGIQPHKAEVTGDSMSLQALTPASISSIPSNSSEEESENKNKQTDDATVLIQRPPPK